MTALGNHGLTKRYDALSGVTLTVRAGSIHGLVGPNGSGKTTLLRSVLRLARPDAGTIQVLGDDRARAAARPQGGLAGLVADPRLYPYLSARENLRLLAILDGGDDTDPAAALERVGLTDVADRKVGGISLGMRQRLGQHAAVDHAMNVGCAFLRRPYDPGAASGADVRPSITARSFHPGDVRRARRIQAVVMAHRRHSRSRFDDAVLNVMAAAWIGRGVWRIWRGRPPWR
jgi:ABC-type Na+ transport system ATPase subunit NatA